MKTRLASLPMEASKQGCRDMIFYTYRDMRYFFVISRDTNVNGNRRIDGYDEQFTVGI